MNRKRKLEEQFRSRIRVALDDDLGPGWTRKQAAMRLCVNPSSFGKWDQGRSGTLVPTRAAETWGGWFDERLSEYLSEVRAYNLHQKRKGALRMEKENRRRPELKAREVVHLNYCSPHPQPARPWRR